VTASSQGPDAVTKEYEALTHRIKLRQLRRTATNLVKLSAGLERNDDYPTETAKSFCKLIRCTSQLILDRVGNIPQGKVPLINTILQQWGSFLRFAERSRIEHTPWSMVQSVEAFLRENTGDNHCFILRPQWNFNYRIYSELVGVLRTTIAGQSDWLPLDAWEAAVGDISKLKISCISFPRLERNNALSMSIGDMKLGTLLQRSGWEPI